MAEGTGDVRFGRSAFGGFNRKDVMDYIDTLQRAAAAKGGDPDMLGQITRERDALEQENRRLREENMQLRAHLKVEQTTNELLDEKRRAPAREEPLSEADAPASQDDPKRLTIQDVDEMVQKYFG